MRWTARTALAGTAGVALVGAGVLTAAYAATGSPQPAPAVGGGGPPPPPPGNPPRGGPAPGPPPPGGF